MDWIHNYQLFLFDFDGILVNTEELHYKAYLKMCSDRGFYLKWDMRTYIRYAMYTSTGIREAIYKEFPALTVPWETLYAEKKRAYFELLQLGTTLIAGVEQLLKALEQAGIKRCVVTHSPHEQISAIRKQHPILNSIPDWITREHYSQPKPSSECYHKAIAQFKSGNDRVIGFEDSPRGLQALLGTSAEGILVSNYFDSSEIKELGVTLGREFPHFSSFSELFKKHSA